MKLISKSKYLNGLQCEKLLWHYYYAKNVFPEADSAVQAIFDQGHEIGKLAQSLYPGGVEITNEYYDINGSLEETSSVLAERKPVFEAAFKFNNTYARVDILAPAEKNEWDIIEVKSSTGVKEVHLHDLSVQKYILEGCGLKIRKCFLMHIDNQYVRCGSINAGGLFRLSDETEAVNKLLPNVEERLKKMQLVLQQKKVPNVNVGSQCSSPYQCPLLDMCWNFLPEKHNVFSLCRGDVKAFELMKAGVLSIEKIPEGYDLSVNQKTQLAAVKKNKPHIDKEAIRTFINGLAGPLYFLDFETIMPGIPLFDRSRPYQQIPFQFSVFYTRSIDEKANGISFLAEGNEDPRPELLRQLKAALGTDGPIVCYNAGFEISRIKEMAEDFPEYGSWAEAIEKRVVDLLKPFSSFHYYHPEQQGTASFKAVLPVLTGRSYDDLEISEGGTASREFLRVTFMDGVSASERLKVRANLIEYCDQDTHGMLEVIRALKKIAA